MNTLFSHLEQLDSQVIIRRLTDRSMTLSPDDLVLEGEFNSSLIADLSRVFPPPLSFKVEIPSSTDPLIRYSAFEWQQYTLLFCGVSLLPFHDIQQQIGFENAWQYLRLLATTEAGSLLKPLLAVKPKGLISVDHKYVEFILPMHRIDFLLTWLEQLLIEDIDLNWLSGSLGNLSDELLTSVGSIDQSRLPVLQTWLERTSSTDDLDFQQLFNRAMHILS